MIKKIISFLVVITILVSLTSCSSISSKDKQSMLTTPVTLTLSADGYLVYNGVKTKIKVEGLKGRDGVDGINGANGINGTIGTNGLDGQTPFIGSNGNWWIGTTDTNVKASGGTSDFIYKSITLEDDLVGAVQKGPFISGTLINFYELDQSFQQTGFSYSTRTTDNVGNFSLRKGLKLSSNNLLFVAQGFYFNEVLGKNSEVPLTLYLVSDIFDKTKVNINLLTTLEHERVMYLVENGLTYEAASNQARNEILSIFYISKPDMSSSQDLDITKSGNDNAILLAISTILQGYRSTSELSLLLAEIGNDIKTDGILNNERLKTNLINDAMLLNLQEIRSNLEKFYLENNISVDVPNFENYVNMFINNNSASQNPYIFTKNIIYPENGSTGPNVLYKSFTSMADVYQNFNGVAIIPVGARLRIVYTTIGSLVWLSSPNNQLLTEYNEDMTVWTVTFNDHSAFGYGYTEFGVSCWESGRGVEVGGEMFRIDYYENGALTPTFSKIVLRSDIPQ
jgi:hypothetical protein